MIIMLAGLNYCSYFIVLRIAFLSSSLFLVNLDSLLGTVNPVWCHAPLLTFGANSIQVACLRVGKVR